MRIVRTTDDLHLALAGEGRIALVPTMGALHDGHRALLRAARGGADTVVMSLFVNAAQFGAGEDFAAYPRDEGADVAVAADEGVDVVFAPDDETVYPSGFVTVVDPGPLGDVLCGRSRPGHFRGVATVVARLLGLVRPDVALFGEKDWQQLVVIRRMTRDLALPHEIGGVPTVRDSDGLALSSRNAYLRPVDRPIAASLPAGLLAARGLYAAGERDAGRLLAAVRDRLLAAPEYVELRERDDLGPYRPDRPAVLALAARVGRARLIDNVQLVPDPIPT
jgi:pantoate--beta-alanine ligase